MTVNISIRTICQKCWFIIKTKTKKDVSWCCGKALTVSSVCVLVWYCSGSIQSFVLHYYFGDRTHPDLQHQETTAAKVLFIGNIKTHILASCKIGNAVTNLSSFEGFFWSSYAWYKIVVDAGPHLNRFLLAFLFGLSPMVSTSSNRLFPGELYSR